MTTSAMGRRVAFALGLAFLVGGCNAREIDPGTTASEGLVFVQRTEHGADLWRARLGDGAVRPLLKTADSDEAWPFWSPAAEALLFQAGQPDGRTRLQLWDRRTEAVRPLTDRSHQTERWGVWSPSGERVAFAFGEGSASGIAEVDIARGERRLVTAPRPNRVFYRPEYAPDSRRLLAIRHGETRGSATQLWILDRDRPARRIAALHEAYIDKARFSPNGAWILFSHRRSRMGPGSLALIRPGGGGLRRFASLPTADDHSARYSPTRAEIAFISNRDGSRDLFLADLSGDPPRNLSSTPAFMEGGLRWSPDGQLIAVSQMVPADGRVSRAGPARPDPLATRIAVFDRQGRRIFETAGSMPDWMPPW